MIWKTELPFGHSSPALSHDRIFLTAARSGRLVTICLDRRTGRILWVPISVVALAFMAAHALLSLVHGRLPAQLAAWSILRPRRYDPRLAAAVLETARRDAPASQATDGALQVLDPSFYETPDFGSPGRDLVPGPGQTT